MLQGIKPCKISTARKSNNNHITEYRFLLGIPFHLEGRKISNQAEVKRLYSVIEVSKILGIGKAKVYELINSGQLSALKLGGLKVRSKSLDEFLDKYDGYDLTNMNNIKKVVS